MGIMVFVQLALAVVFAFNALIVAMLLWRELRQRTRAAPHTTRDMTA